MASFFQPEPGKARRPRAPYLRVVPTQPTRNRWLVPSLACGLVFPAVLLIFAVLFALAPGFRFPFFQGAVGLITIVPTGLGLITGGLAFLHERRLAPVSGRKTLYRLAVTALTLASVDLLATIVLVIWGVVTATVATGGTPF